MPWFSRLSRSAIPAPNGQPSTASASMSARDNGWRLWAPTATGKSSLLKAVAGLVPVYRGTIYVFGNPVGACHHRVAYLPQRGEIDWHFPISVERLVLTGRYVHLGWFRWPGENDRQIAKKMLRASRAGIVGQTANQPAFRRAAAAGPAGSIIGPGSRLAAAR